MKRKSVAIALLAASWLLAASLPAVAVTTYAWDTSGCSGVNSVSCTDATPTPGLTISAISDTGSAGTASVPGAKLLHEAYVVNYAANGHLGVTSEAGFNSAGYTGGNAAGAEETKNSPQHALDNDGNSEFMLLTVGSNTKVSLTGVTLGWSQNDSDLTVLAYTGSNFAVDWAATTTYAGTTGLLNHGWSLIGNYLNVCGATSNCNNNQGIYSTQVGNQTATIATNVTSSYWLVGAFNALGATVAGSDTNYDYVKVLGFSASSSGTGTGQGVPEPSSLLLMGIALASLTMLRRRGVI